MSVDSAMRTQEAARLVRLKGLSQSVIARRLKLDPSTVCAVLHGRRGYSQSRERVLALVHKMAATSKDVPQTLAEALRMHPLANKPTVPAGDNPPANLCHNRMSAKLTLIRGLAPAVQVQALEMFIAKGLSERQVAKIAKTDTHAVHYALCDARCDRFIRVRAAVYHAVRILKPRASRFALKGLAPQIMALRRKVVQSGLTADQLGAAISRHPVSIRKLLNGSTCWSASPTYRELKAWLDRNREPGTQNQEPLGQTHSRNTRPHS